MLSWLDLVPTSKKNRYDHLRGANEVVDAALKTETAGEALRKTADTNAADTEFLATIEARINAAGYAAAFADDLDRSLKKLLGTDCMLSSPSKDSYWLSL